MVNALVNTLLFKPPKNHEYEFPSRIILRRTIRTGEQIAATYLRRKDAHVTILFSHGNAEDLNTCCNWMRKMSKDLNVNMIAYDYPGYGESTGEPSEENCYAAIDSMFEYLVTVIGLSPHQIVLYGRSLGSGPSCYLAEKTAAQGNSVAGLILHSPFTSVYRVVLPFSMLGDQFPNVDRVANFRCPVFIMHGTEDPVVPFEHGLALFDAVPEEYRAEPYWFEGGHNQHSREVGSEIVSRINKFLDFHILARRLWLLPASSSQQGQTRRRLLRV